MLGLKPMSEDMDFYRKVMYLLVDHGAHISWDMTKGCRCLCCHSYTVTLDCGDTEIQDEYLDKAIDKAWEYAEKGSNDATK